jgi:hypothetical protein
LHCLFSNYRANCAECNASWHSSAFKSNKIGTALPPKDKRVLGFVHESDINNRICPRCDKKNYKLLKQRSAATVANDARKEIAHQGTKRGRDVISKMSRKVVHKQQKETDGLASLCAVVQEEIEDAMEGKI